MKKEKNRKSNTPEKDAPPPLTEEEIALIKASMAARDVDRSTLPSQDNSDRAKALRFIKKNKILSAAVAVIAVFALVLVVLLCVVAVNKALDGRVNTDDYTFFVGDEEYTVKYKTAVRDGILYVDMYKVASYARLTRTGSKTDVKFTAAEDQYLRFENGSQYAVINGAMVEMSGAATVNEEVCEVPFDFLMKAIGANNQNGLKLTLDSETNTVKIQRRMYKTDDKDVILPVEITFYSDSFNVIQAIKRPAPEEEKEYEYSIDISAYESSIDPENTEEFLILANKQTPLGADYSPSDLKQLECRTDGRTMYLREDAANALYAMMLAMSAEGINDVYVTSAYRRYDRQAQLFEGYVNNHMAQGMTREEAEAAALEYSAKPGTSEHQTGLCLDFMTEDMNDLDETFEDTEAFEWLSLNAYKYGFILRYPSDKVSTTGYKYEPWHYRFVGRTSAAEIYASELCLEEYLELN